MLGTWKADGEKLTIETTCGAGLSVTEFTASPTTTVLAELRDRGVMLSTFTRMP